MGENDKAGAPEEQATNTWRRWELGHGHRREDWPDPLREPDEPAQDELDLLHSQVPGHHWNAWRCLTDGEAYFAACSCGWRGSQTGRVSATLGQVYDHLDAVRAARGWRPARRDARAPHRDAPEREAGQGETPAAGRARELYASMEGQQQRLAQTVERLGELLVADEELADRRVAALECEAARVAQEHERDLTPASVQRAEALKRGLDRARELRQGIASAAAAMAVVAEEITWVHQGPETSHERPLTRSPGTAGAAGERGAFERSP